MLITDPFFNPEGVYLCNAPLLNLYLFKEEEEVAAAGNIPGAFSTDEKIASTKT